MFPLHPDRLLPTHEPERTLARDLYESVKDLPIISPHGHTDPAWFADNNRFSDPTSLFITPDHYVLRMFGSQGISYDDLGVPRKDGKAVETDPRKAWRIFASHYHLFDGTPSKIWVDHAMQHVLGVDKELNAQNADVIYDHIMQKLGTPALLPRAILENAKVELIATTEFALDPLVHHQKMVKDGYISRVITTYRPDDVVNPDFAGGSPQNILKFGEITGEDVTTWAGLMNAHRKRREYFRAHGATATDHDAANAMTADLTPPEKQKLLDTVLKGNFTPQEAELFRAQMLTELALMSVEDGMTMQLHIGSKRNTDVGMYQTRGPNMGADIPKTMDCVHGLSALLNKCGREKDFRLLVFVLDETLYARELAPMAGYWPCMMIGPPWWFHDSPQGMRRYLDQCVETAGFYNLAGFNDDTRALLSIPARHDVWRREACRFLAERVAEHRISKTAASEIAHYLCYRATKDAYKLGN
ncbi:MAG: glucuronate isomerase [Alphaproteobacteria bacterium]|nr:glucuronate isomerase [Alphaproteobacteria bacterium]